MNSMSAGARAISPLAIAYADARQILHHHAAGADIEMADFGIAHLAVGQADVFAGRTQKAVRSGLPQPIESRRFRLAYGVIRRVLAPAPAVQNDQHNRPPLLHLSSLPSDNAKGYYGSKRERQSMPLLLPARGEKVGMRGPLRWPENSRDCPQRRRANRIAQTRGYAPL